MSYTSNNRKYNNKPLASKLHFGEVKQALTLHHKLPWNSLQSFCLTLPSARITWCMMLTRNYFYLCVLACVWRPEINFECLLQLYFQDRDSHWLDKLAGQKSSSSYLSSTEIRHMLTRPPINTLPTGPSHAFNYFFGASVSHIQPKSIA